MHDTPHEPGFDAGTAFRWIIGGGVVVFMAYQSFLGLSSTLQDTWPKLQAMHYGFSAVPHGAMLQLASIRRAVESNAAILGIALLAIWLLPRKRASAAAVQLSDDSRRLQAIILLAFPFLIIPNSLVLLLWTVMEYQDGQIDYPAYGAFFATLAICAFFFVVISEALYGRRNTAINDELRQHFRSKAIRSGYWAMLVSGVILYAAAIASPLWASMALPLMLLAGVVVPIFRFALLELFTGVG